MKDFLVNLIKLLISFVVLLFTEEYFNKLLGTLNIHISKTFTEFIVYLIISICFYIIYKDELKSGIKKYKRKFLSNFIYSFVAFLVIFTVILITNYLCKVIGKSFYLNYTPVSFFNIFNRPFNLELILLFIKSIILIPYLKVTVFALGVNKLFDYNASIIISGLSAAVYHAYLIGGTIPNMIINSIPSFVLFLLLALIYRKNNNIVVSITTYSLYMFLAGILYSNIMWG